MWDLETIIRINNEAQWAFEKKNAYEAHQRQEEERGKRVCEEETAVFDGFTNLRSLYEGEIDGCSSQSRSGEELS
ncbi:MAG: hypothetical protein CMC82_02545 [Flavobacteriaceae bacterium]|nr:hypothetical protein [Flavobacteriaceae bacterium]|tara:strand:- start:1586 stop:1810 length:225 start_codon:yes stop_codon:yes gene_type:complete